MSVLILSVRKMFATEIEQYVRNLDVLRGVVAAIAFKKRRRAHSTPPR